MRGSSATDWAPARSPERVPRTPPVPGAPPEAVARSGVTALPVPCPPRPLALTEVSTGSVPPRAIAAKETALAAAKAKPAPPGRAGGAAPDLVDPEAGPGVRGARGDDRRGGEAVGLQRRRAEQFFEGPSGHSGPAGAARRLTWSPGEPLEPGEEALRGGGGAAEAKTLFTVRWASASALQRAQVARCASTRSRASWPSSPSTSAASRSPRWCSAGVGDEGRVPLTLSLPPIRRR